MNLHLRRFTAILFDFDGVIADTEPQYDLFFGRLAEEYQLGKNFAGRIKGITLATVMEKHFYNYPPAEQTKITESLRRYEREMTYTFIPGAREAIARFRAGGYKIAVVTSSPNEKMAIALQKMQLENAFDALITADKITRGKPDPMCYLLAASALCVPPQECVVFEDSIAGITAGITAGMKVIALATTLPADTLAQYTDTVIPDFLALGEE
ncbi:MAG: HAD family phosphatase [Prevotellaceae bacterium]|jgi:HAD superfamily hydrolase (TIGR01509 family)|nr:HAD family phosphatase [Prevotellaceae bacterium]